MTRYLGRNEILTTKDNEFKSVAISLLWHEPPMLFPRPDLRGRHTWTVGNVKIALSENIAFLLHPLWKFRAVWLLRNLTLDGKLCLRNDRNADFV